MYVIEIGTLTDGEYLRSDGTVSPFTDVPATFYWAISTFTTVGYGDIYPIEYWGEFIASVAMILGIFLFAAPLAVILSAFQSAYRDHSTKSAAKKMVKSTDTGIVHVLDLVDALRESQRNVALTIGEVDSTLTLAKDIQHYPLAWKSAQEAINIQLDNLTLMLLNSCKLMEQKSTKDNLDNMTSVARRMSRPPPQRPVVEVVMAMNPSTDAGGQGANV